MSADLLSLPSLLEPVPFQARIRLLDFMRQADEPGLINLAAGVPGEDALPVEALRQAAEIAFREYAPAALKYHHPEGNHELRGLLAARLQSRGVQVRAEEIVTTTGCTQALQVILAALVRPGDVVACEAPAYYGLLELLSAAGARVLPLPMAGEAGLDLEATEALLARWRPRCVVVCSTLSNPSGATLPDRSRSRLVQICGDLGIRLIDDDIYGELLEGGAPKPLRAWDPSGEVVTYVTSFCKTVAPGLRVGFSIPGPAWHEQFAEIKCRQDLHSAPTTEVILREFLKLGALDPHLAWLRTRNRTVRELALKTIARTFPEGSTVTPPRGGYMLWVNLPEGVELPAAQKAARAQGVIFAAGHVFYPNPAPPPAIRLNCAKASSADLEKGIAILGQIFAAQLA